MTISDPIADMLTRMRNALMVEHAKVVIPSSRIKVAIAKILKDEGYIANYSERSGDNSSRQVLRIQLKYVGERRSRRPVISGLERVSKPGCRVYAGKREIPWVRSGIGITILSTPKGVMTGQRARQLGVGGEILCKVW
jgi:small subunit ribosomal protein S8